MGDDPVDYFARAFDPARRHLGDARQTAMELASLACEDAFGRCLPATNLHAHNAVGLPASVTDQVFGPFDVTKAATDDTRTSAR